MASMSCCKTWASPPFDPCGPYLVFLITSKGSITNANGIKFYRAPRWAPNVFVRLTSGKLDGQAPFLFCLLLVHWNNASLRQRGLYLLITL